MCEKGRNINSRIQNWLKAGAEIQSGLLLFSQVVKNDNLYKFIRLNPNKHYKLLKQTLCRAAGIKYEDDVTVEETVTTSPAIVNSTRKIRTDYPFLSSPNCPHEFKILVADKITAYHNYCEAHKELFNCTTRQQCYATAKIVVDNFLENRAIFTELDYYREHNSILGKHKIFSYLSKVDMLRRLQPKQLVAEQKRLEHAIWRTQSEIKKGDKPDLNSDREQRIATKETLLIEVQKLLKDYGYE